MAEATDLAVKKLKPEDERYFAWYGDGLGVRVAPSGKKTWVYWYRDGERKRLMTLGVYPAVSVAKAIEEHTAARLAHLRGEDPAANKKKAKREAAEAARAERLATDKPTLRKLVAKMEASPLFANKTSAPEILRRIRKDILPFRCEGETVPLGDMPLADVKKRHAVEVIDAVRKRGNRIGNMCAADFVRLGRYGETSGMLDDDTPNRFRGFELAPEPPRHRALGMPLEKGDTEDRTWEVARLLDRLPKVRMYPTVRLVLLFAMATGQRPSEVAAMPKAELKAGDLWVIPASRRGKNNEPLAVPLSLFAREVLKLAALYNTGSPWVFPAPKDSKRPMDIDLITKTLRETNGTRKADSRTPKNVEPEPGMLGLPHFVTNDLRHTYRSWASRLGIRLDIAERAIGHKQGLLVETYDQHPFLDERREAFDKWGAYMTKVAPKLLATLRKMAREGVTQ